MSLAFEDKAICSPPLAPEGPPEASALAKVPLAGTSHTVGVEDFHKI